MQDITQSELILNLILSASLFGVIWIVQLVQYPSFRLIPQELWKSYHNQHMYLISWVVMPLMTAELFLGGWLVWRSGPFGDWFVPFLMILGIWLSTFFIQIPIHNKLIDIKSEALVGRLIRTNWIRTALWSIKLIYISWLCYWAFS